MASRTRKCSIIKIKLPTLAVFLFEMASSNCKINKVKSKKNKETITLLWKLEDQSGWVTL